MDKIFIIALIKFLMNYFKITDNELGLSQKYRKVAFGGTLNVQVPSIGPKNDHYLGIVSQMSESKTAVNFQITGKTDINIVDKSTKRYFIVY